MKSWWSFPLARVDEGCAWNPGLEVVNLQTRESLVSNVLLSIGFAFEHRICIHRNVFRACVGLALGLVCTTGARKWCPGKLSTRVEGSQCFRGVAGASSGLLVVNMGDVLMPIFGGFWVNLWLSLGARRHCSQLGCSFFLRNSCPRLIRVKTCDALW